MANRYSRALKQIKDKTLDEKLQLLSEIPTNNTAGVFVDTPGRPAPEEIIPGDIDSPLNLEQDGDGAEGYTGDDTTGLFESDGTIRTVEPPGDTSYVLGPMMSMWYAWANYTQIGYVRQSDRRMVNLGRITGEMSDWDGVSGFTSYGQLTLEQAVWFKNQSRSDYRAFYPGPPSNPADEYGRYIGSMIDTSKAVLNTLLVNPFKRFLDGIGVPFDPNDIFSALMDRLGDAFSPIKDLIDGLGYQAEKLLNGLTDGLNLLNDVKSVLDRAEKTNSILPPGHELGDPNFPDRPTLVPGSEGSRENPLQRTLSDTTNATLMNGITRDMSPSELRAQVQKNINSDFNFGAKGTLNNLTSDPYFDSEGNLIIKDTYAFDPGGDIADKPFLFGGTTGDFAKNFSNDPERQKDVLTMFDKSVGALIPGTPGRKDPVVHFEIKISPPNPEVQARQDFQKTMSMDNFNKLSKSDQNKVMNALSDQHKSRSDGSNFKDAPKYMKDRFKASAKEAGKTKFKDGYMVDKDPNTGKTRKTPIFSTIPGMSSVLAMGHKPSGKLLTESQKRVLRDIKKPVQVKEIPSKVKVSPKLRNKNKTVGGDMMKTPNVPNQFKPPAPNIWATKDREKNIKASQEKKNQVLELVGAAEHHWTWLTEESRKKKQEKVNEMMSAEYDKQMELLYEKHKIKESKINKVISAFKKPTDIKPEFPKDPPPQMDPKTGMHPKYGKNYKHDKLDPQSAEAMPLTGNPEVDANIKKATNAKEKARKLKILHGKNIKEETTWSKISKRIKELKEDMTTASLGMINLPAAGDIDIINTDTTYDNINSSLSQNVSRDGTTITLQGTENQIVDGVNTAYNIARFDVDATRVSHVKITISKGGGTSSWTDRIPEETFDDDVTLNISDADNFFAPIYNNTNLTSGTHLIRLPGNYKNLRISFEQFAKVPVIGEPDSTGALTISNVSLQRRDPINLVVPLDDPEANAFIRGGLGGDKERRKKLKDMLESGNQWMYIRGLEPSKTSPGDIELDTVDTGKDYGEIAQQTSDDPSDWPSIEKNRVEPVPAIIDPATGWPSMPNTPRRAPSGTGVSYPLA